MASVSQSDPLSDGDSEKQVGVRSRNTLYPCHLCMSIQFKCWALFYFKLLSGAMLGFDLKGGFATNKI